CPQVPETAWCAPAKLYREAVSHSAWEAPDNYHFAGFLLVVAAGLGKSAYTTWAGDPIYPNVYFSLVGGLAGGYDLEMEQEAAIHLTERLSNGANPDVRWVGPISSKLDFIRGMCRLQREHPGLALHAVVANSLYYSDFVEESYRKNGGTVNRNIFLRSLFYRSEVERSFSYWRPKQTFVVNDPPAVCLLGTSRPDFLANLRKEQVHSGLAGHVMFVPGVPKPPIPRQHPPFNEPWTAVLQGLKDVFEFWHDRGTTDLDFTEAAKDIWGPWYVAQEGEPETLFEKLSARHWVQMLKVAIIFAALDKSLALDVQHLEAAKSFVDFLVQSLDYILAEAASSPSGAERNSAIV
ncbi:MAG: hypothetical protein ACRD3T_08995, partial [Terriglobia bacterium]